MYQAINIAQHFAVQPPSMDDYDGERGAKKKIKGSIVKIAEEKKVHFLLKYKHFANKTVNSQILLKTSLLSVVSYSLWTKQQV